MSSVIKRLSPELADTFVDYLSSLDFNHAPHWATCFCRFYHTDCSGEQWQSRTGDENRAEAVLQIKAGTMKGYLAFDGEKCIGWCNANDLLQYKRFGNDFDYITKGHKTGCVICYVIHPDYRRQGVARLLLRQAVEDFKAQGFDAVLALPVENAGEPEKLYRGTLNMYKELGFELIEKDGITDIMWLKF
ncbi:MAG: GNAT family N-acetyltransferase [Pseudomonadota bacterium]